MDDYGDVLYFSYCQQIQQKDQQRTEPTNKYCLCIQSLIYRARDL